MKGVTVADAVLVESIEVHVLPEGDVHLSFRDDGSYVIPVQMMRFVFSHVVAKWIRKSHFTDEDATTFCAQAVAMHKACEKIGGAQ